MKVIPFDLYEKLLEDGILEKYYPVKKIAKYKQFIVGLPITLQEKAEKILNSLSESKIFDWNDKGEFTFNGKLYENSNIKELIEQLALGSKSFYKLPHNDIFLQVLRELKVPHTAPVNTSTPQKILNKKRSKNKKNCHSWITFEDKLVLK